MKISKYQPVKIESKWQEKWQKEKLYQASVESKKPKKYVLDMFPYPSGDGLHVGHFKGYVATDIISRYYRMRGFNVLHPMGWDAFGLPAENYAIKKGIHPKITTEKNISNIKKQMETVGLSYDWDREVDTTDPEYYKWTQWIFLKLFEKGLAYEAEAPINWCPVDKTGLANEEVLNGTCERCGSKVERKVIRQWILKITAYADRLLADLDGLDWPQAIKDMQINWIGKSEGIEINFPLSTPVIPSPKKVITVYTKFPETIFGVTYMVIAPEHKLLAELTTDEYQEAVNAYVEATKNKSDLERTSLEKTKTGVFTGSYCVNQVNGEKVPIWVSDYVIGTYGTGAVMGVPGSDHRDFEFAKKFGLKITRVIGKTIDDQSLVQTANDVLESGWIVNSSQFNGLQTPEPAKEQVLDWLAEQGFGQRKVNYHLRDWIFSRQRYWGEPIPIVHCDKCGMVPVPESELPLKLPEVEKYQPTGTGESPLASIDEWVNTKCPNCAGLARRETNTMPQWAGSCWYYLRFCNPQNSEKLVSGDNERYWMPVDWYVGGAAHAVLHLLYSRFWHKFLYDIKVVTTQEPFQKLSPVGLVLAEDGRKMSKSLGNVVSSDQIVGEYGADTLRLYECFMGPFENSIAWDPTSINGVYKFLNRVWEVITRSEVEGSNHQNKIDLALNKLVGKAAEDIEAMKFNTAIASMMEFINLVYHTGLTDTQKQQFLLVLAPFAPHITEELYFSVILTHLGGSGSLWSVHQQSWPEFDSNQVLGEEITIVIQVNGKTRSLIVISKDILNHKEVVEKIAQEDEKAKKFIQDKTVVKTIYIPGKIINFVLS